jgi:hypothetical protein
MRRSMFRFTCAVLLSVLPVACDSTGTSDVTSDAGADIPSQTDVPSDPGPVTAGLCGLSYTPLSVADTALLGTVVSWEEDSQYMLTAETLDAVLATVGYSSFSPLPYGSRLYRVRYRTQDKGVIHQATTLVGVPQPAEGGVGTYPSVLWLHGTTGFSDPCAPSRTLEGAAGAVVMAALGFVGVAPDYLGMSGDDVPSDMPHPYLEGQTTAFTSLDAVRAAHALLKSGEITDEPGRPDDQVIPWGGSQGGHAALWVDRVAGTYAPEFRVPATVAVIPPADLAGQAEVAFQAVCPGLSNFAAFMTSAQRWYGAPASMAGVLTDTDPRHYASQLPITMDTLCGDGDMFDGVTAVDQIFEASFLAQTTAAGGISHLEPWGCYMRENSLPTTSTPRVGKGPVLFVLSEKDELVNRLVERQSFQTLCGQGYAMQFLECAGARHAQGGLWSLAEQKDWLLDRLAGKPMDTAKTCVLSDPVVCSGTPAE